MFDLYGTDRLVAWKNFRDQLETSLDPYKDTMVFWRKAPYVSDYLEDIATEDWPDPWRLVIDGKYDNLAINLGILYTLQLTKRFITVPMEIHRLIDSNRHPRNFVVVANNIVVDYDDYNVYDFKNLENTVVMYSSSNK